MADQAENAEDPRDARIRELEAAVKARDEKVALLRQELEEARSRLPPDLSRIVKEVKKRFTQFITNRVNPGYMDRHRGDLSSWTPELWREAGSLGLLGFGAPVSVGGDGRDAIALGIMLEEMGKLIEDPGFLMISQINKNWATYIGMSGREDLAERYAKPIIRGEHLLSWAIWEPADPLFLSSTARKVEGGWVLNAHKPFVTGAAYATLFAVVVREEASGDAVLFLVEAKDEGVQRQRVKTVGAHHGGFCSLTLKNVHVPDDRLFIDTDAFARISPVFNQGIMNTPAIHLGWMQRMLGLCIESLRPKVRAGASVLDIPHVQQEIGRLQMGVEVTRGMFLRLLEKYRHGEADPAAEPMAAAFKHFLTERTIDTARTLLTLQGAAGYIDDEHNPWGRYLTHVLCLVHAAGAQDVAPMHMGARFLAELELQKLRKFTF
jgi:alkylation response protein AidB-like acyl-CoA dehydrogenase